MNEESLALKQEKVKSGERVARASDAEVLRRAAATIRTMADKAIAGLWVARHETNDGFPLDHEPRDADFDPEDFDGEFGDIALVAGTALPRTDRGQEGRSPGHYESHHLMAEHDETDLAPSQAQELLDSFRWAALMSPVVAAPLADWLTETAVQVAGSEEAGFDCRMAGSRYLPALLLADALLGGAS